MGNGTTMISRRRVLAAGVALPLVVARKARAQAATIKIGVLNDMSGPYRDLSARLKSLRWIAISCESS
jgi:hypothetical protein